MDVSCGTDDVEVVVWVGGAAAIGSSGLNYRIWVTFGLSLKASLYLGSVLRIRIFNARSTMLVLELHEQAKK